MLFGKPWTEEEDALLIAMAGRSRHEVSAALGRSQEAITRRRWIIKQPTMAKRRFYPEATEEHIKLRWLEGASASTIGRERGMTKNAVIGKVHRMGLPSRQSPIGNGGAQQWHGRPRQPPRAAQPPRPPRSAATLPPLVSLASVMCAPAAPVVRLPPAPVPRLVETFGPPVAPRVYGQCCWPLGEPGTRAFRYCDGDVMDRGSYCAACRKKAYTPRRQAA